MTCILITVNGHILAQSKFSAKTNIDIFVHIDEFTLLTVCYFTYA